MTDVKNIIFQNYLQAKFLYKHLLSNNNDFNYLKYMLNHDPHLSEGNKSRYDINSPL
jgi:hypothetical protein